MQAHASSIILLVTVPLLVLLVHHCEDSRSTERCPTVLQVPSQNGSTSQNNCLLEADCFIPVRSIWDMKGAEQK